MFGGWGNPCCVTTLNDMHVWNGTAWESVASTVVSDPREACRCWRITAWPGMRARNALIVTGGFTTSWHAPNEETWYVTLANSTGAWQATWTLASGIGCQSAGSSPPDPVVHQGAMMAFDAVAGVQVFFGGEDPDDGSSHMAIRSSAGDGRSPMFELQGERLEHQTDDVDSATHCRNDVHCMMPLASSVAAPPGGGTSPPPVVDVAYMNVNSNTWLTATRVASRPDGHCFR